MSLHGPAPRWEIEDDRRQENELRAEKWELLDDATVCVLPMWQRDRLRQIRANQGGPAGSNLPDWPSREDVARLRPRPRPQQDGKAA